MELLLSVYKNKPKESNLHPRINMMKQCIHSNCTERKCMKKLRMQINWMSTLIFFTFIESNFKTNYALKNETS